MTNDSGRKSADTSVKKSVFQEYSLFKALKHFGTFESENKRGY